jgi:hypothetical protein
MEEIIKLTNQRSDIEWTSYKAVAYIEEFGDLETTFERNIECWAVLIKTKQCWSLQGTYGRTAKDILDSGFINEEGYINWEEIE